MTIEKALRLDVEKPWGRIDLGSWGKTAHSAAAIGERWFQRSGAEGVEPTLLVKLLFTSHRLSIQVHPDDAAARAMGLLHGKTEAWYVLSAAPGAEVAIGLDHAVSEEELCASIRDGSIETLVRWRPVQVGEFIFVPAGTIHAIGAGLVLAEIQQRSDTTFRLFDYGSSRTLHIEEAMKVARREAFEPQTCTLRLSRARQLLLANPHFVIEHLDLPPHSRWQLFAERETWVLPIAGDARIGEIEVSQGGAIYLDAEHSAIHVGSAGLRALVAYIGGSANPMLLSEIDTAERSTPPPRVPATVAPTEIVGAHGGTP